MLQGILIVVAFLVVAALMMTKKIPTLLALPLMAVVICIIAGVPMFGKNADGAKDVQTRMFALPPGCKCVLVTNR